VSNINFIITQIKHDYQVITNVTTTTQNQTITM